MTFWQDKRVLVTGCSGFIGGSLCHRLVMQGATVEGFDIDLEGPLEVRGIRVYGWTGDIRLYWMLERTIRMVQPNVIFHLAAISGVEQSRADALQAWEVNVQGTWNVLEAARQSPGLQAIVVPSSNHVYGPQSKAGPTDESAPLNQLDTYSVSKICADYIGRAYRHNYGLPVSVIRHTNCFGPFDPHADHIVPSVILAILEGRPIVLRGDGKTRKSYLYVDDVAEAYMRLVEGGVLPEVINVTGPTISVMELVEEIKGLMGVPGHPVQVGNAVPDQHDEMLDDRAFRELTGWKPTHSLTEALRKTIGWFELTRKVAA